MTGPTRPESAIGMLIESITRIFYQFKNDLDESNGCLELVGESTVLTFDVGPDGEQLVVGRDPWRDPFDATMTAENQQWIDGSSRFVVNRCAEWVFTLLFWRRC